MRMCPRPLCGSRFTVGNHPRIPAFAAVDSGYELVAIYGDELNDINQ